MSIVQVELCGGVMATSRWLYLELVSKRIIQSRNEFHIHREGYAMKSCHSPIKRRARQTLRLLRKSYSRPPGFPIILAGEIDTYRLGAISTEVYLDSFRILNIKSRCGSKVLKILLGI